MEFTYIYLEKSRSLGAPAGGERIKGVQLLLRRESGRRAGAIEGDSLFSMTNCLAKLSYSLAERN